MIDNNKKTNETQKQANTNTNAAAEKKPGFVECASDVAKWAGTMFMVGAAVTQAARWINEGIKVDTESDKKWSKF